VTALLVSRQILAAHGASITEAAARGCTDGWCGCPPPLRMTVPAVSNDNREEKP
jgi:hypothetical protein